MQICKGHPKSETSRIEKHLAPLLRRPPPTHLEMNDCKCSLGQFLNRGPVARSCSSVGSGSRRRAGPRAGKEGGAPAKTMGRKRPGLTVLFFQAPTKKPEK